MSFKVEGSMLEFAKDFSLAQGEFPKALKDSANPFFKSKYADFESTVEACRPALAKFGFSFLQMVSSNEEKQSTLVTMLLHKSGSYITTEVSMLTGKGDIQALGSAITYYKRYALQAMLGIATSEDDDGEKAMARNVQIKHERPTEKKEIVTSLLEPADAKSINALLNAFRGLGVNESMLVDTYGYPDIKNISMADLNALREIGISIKKDPTSFGKHFKIQKERNI